MQAYPKKVCHRVRGQVHEFDWNEEGHRDAAITELQAFCSASIQNLGLQSFEPMLLKGAVADWPAVEKWSLDWLVENFGQQRCAWHPRLLFSAASGSQIW